MSQESDDLWKYVHAVVSERVPPEHREAVTELVARTTAHILTTPEFLFGLRVVRDLRDENERLRRAVVTLQSAHMPAPRARKRAAAPRKAPAKKAAPRKAAAPRKNAAAKKVPAAQKRAFKKGARGH